MRLMLIEDDVMLSNALNKALDKEGFVVDAFDNGKQAIASANNFAPELVILDLGLPDMDGIEVLQRLRQTHSTLPILILTARGTISDKVKALDGGADDYLAKPFEMAELLARIRVLARRLGTAVSSTIEIQDVVLDIASHKVSVANQLITLTRREFMVLKALMENAGRIQTKQIVEEKLYGWGEEIASNTVEVHVSNVRKKLPKDFIKTIRGVGYTIER